MAISTNGTIITRLAGALYNEYLSNASYTELNTTPAATVAANMLSSDFAGKTDAQIATTVLTNLGLSSVAGLNNWVAAQLTGAGSTAAAKGAKLVSMLNDFAMMTADATYGSYAKTFNDNTAASLTNSQTAKSAAGAFGTAGAVAAKAAADAAAAAAAAEKAAADAAAAKAAADKAAADKVIADKAAADKAAADKVIADAAAAEKAAADKAAADKLVPQKFVLTTGVDTGADFTGKDGSDTYTATTTSTGLQTLTAGDNLSGGLGADTLNITNTVANATLGAGVITSSIETVNVTATGTTTVDASGFAGVTSVGSIGSTENVTFTGLQTSIPAINLTGSNKDLTVTLAGALTAGIADSATINLNGAASTANSTVTVNGIENLTVNATGTSGSLDANGNIQSQVTVVSDSLRTLTLSGSGTERVKATLSGAGVGTTAAAATVTGSTGSDDLEFSVPAAGKVTATMGPGDDTVRVSTLAATTTIAGGEGTDTLVYSGTATVAAAAVANVTGFEKVVISGPASVALATSDLTYTVAASGTYTGLAANGTVNLQAGGTVTLANTALTGAADAVTFNVGRSGALGTAATGATITAGEFDVVTVNASARSNVLATDTAAYSVSGTTLNKVTLTAPHGATLSGGGAALTTIDASGVQGPFSSTAATSSTAALAITGGSGNDAITGGSKADVLIGGAGDDTITGGIGQDTLTGGTGNDTFSFAVNNGEAAVVSGSSGVDTITDFESGKDRLLFAQQNDKFVGNVANIQLGLAAMTANNQSFYVTSENQVYVVATKGTLSQNDTVVKLSSSVTALAISGVDVGAGTVATGGADITLTAANTLTQTVSTTGGSAPTAANDTLRSTSLQFLEGTSVNGGNGVDTIAITAGAAASGLTAAEAISLINFERMTLSENTVTGGASITAEIAWDDVNIPSGTFTFDATGLTTIASNFTGVAIDGTAVNGTAGTGVLSLIGSNFIGAGDTLVGGSFNDTINGGAGNDTITGGAGNDSLIGGLGDDTIVASGTDTIDGGVGNDVVQVAGALGASSTDLASIELGAGVNRINYTNNAGTTANATITATAGVYDILVASGVITATMTPAQFAGAFQVLGVNGGGAEGITFSTNGTIDLTKTTDITNVNLSAGSTTTGANTVTATSTTVSITGAGGNDTINVASDTAAAALLTGSVILAGGTADTINVTGNTATTITLSANVTGVESIVFANTSSAPSLTTNDANVTNTTGLLTVSVPAALTSAFTFNGSAETSGAYSVTGGAGDDVFTGGGGSDSLLVLGGANTVIGGAGNDTITSGSGIDRLYGDNGGTKTVTTIIITDTANAELVSNELFTVTIDGIATTYRATTTDVSGDLSSDVLLTMTSLVGAINANTELAGIVTAAAPTVTTTTGSATGTLTFIADGVHTLSFTRGAATASITATTATGTAGTAGTAGDDIITGGAGADLIFGGGGVDTLTGDAGIDRFFFLNGQARLSSLPTITDYRSATGNNAGSLDTILFGDQVAVAGTTATVQDLSTSGSLGAALNAAANTNTANVGLSVFMWGGSTYVYVEATGSGTSFVTTDTLVKITGTPWTTATAIAGLGIDGV